MNDSPRYYQELLYRALIGVTAMLKPLKKKKVKL